MVQQLRTTSGFRKRDVYQELEAAIAAGAREHACCLAAELACTPGELGALLSFTVDQYARWYVCSNVWLQQRLVDLIVDLDAAATAKPAGAAARVRAPQDEAGVAPSPSALARVPAMLAELVLLVMAQRRRASPFQKLAAEATDAALPPPSEEGEEALRAVLVAGEEGAAARGAAARALALLDGVTHGGECGDWAHLQAWCPAHALRAVKPSPRRAPVWRAWRAVMEAAQPHRGAFAYCRTALSLYAYRLTKRSAPARANLLAYAAVAVLRRRVRHQQPDAALQRVLDAAGPGMDAVFEDLLRPDGGSREDEGGFSEAQQREQQPAMPLLPGPADAGGSGPRLDYLQCFTRYDDRTRCAMEAERARVMGESRLAVKTLTLSPSVSAARCPREPTPGREPAAPGHRRSPAAGEHQHLQQHMQQHQHQLQHLHLQQHTAHQPPATARRAFWLC